MLTANHPDAELVTYMPAIGRTIPAAHHRYVLRERAGCNGDGGLSVKHQSTSLCLGSRTPVSLRPISSTSIFWIHSRKSSIVKIPGLRASLKPPTNSAACFVYTFNKLQPKLASTLSFWEWAKFFAAITEWSLLRFSVFHASCEASCSFSSVCL